MTPKSLKLYYYDNATQNKLRQYRRFTFEIVNKTPLYDTSCVMARK